MIRAAVLTISDKCSKGEREDSSGRVIIDMLKIIGAETVKYEIVPDEGAIIREKLVEYCDNEKVDLVFTTGGTGLGPRDVTPEATLAVSEKIIPGISELMRLEGLKRTKNSMLSRGVSMVRKKTIVINLPGSPKGAGESLGAILDIIPHALSMLAGGGHF